ncbi:hypothetical protein P3S68_011491 [Capsicum galapagoense]
MAALVPPPDYRKAEYKEDRVLVDLKVPVARNLNNFDLFFALVRLVWSLLQNFHLHFEPYLHQSMSSVMTCLVEKRLGNKFSDNHWALRDFTEKLVALGGSRMMSNMKKDKN